VPFTGSHVAAVLPFLRTPLSPAALAIGAMAPDVPYYLPLPVAPLHTHSAAGVVGVDVLMGAGVLLVWHLLLARPATAVAPEFVRRRVEPDAMAPLRERGWLLGLLVLYASLAVGSATHVFWDSFTHAGRWGVRQLPWLAETHGALPGYRWAQYASGVFGAAVLLLWLRAWCRRTPRRPDGVVPAWAYRRIAWVVIVAAGIAGALLRSWEPLTRDGGADLRRAAFTAATGGGASAILSALALAVCWHVAERRTKAA
jgi:hypothetical protein